MPQRDNAATQEGVWEPGHVEPPNWRTGRVAPCDVPIDLSPELNRPRALMPSDASREACGHPSCGPVRLEVRSSGPGAPYRRSVPPTARALYPRGRPWLSGPLERDFVILRGVPQGVIFETRGRVTDVCSSTPSIRELTAPYRGDFINDPRDEPKVAFPAIDRDTGGAGGSLVVPLAPGPRRRACGQPGAWRCVDLEGGSGEDRRYARDGGVAGRLRVETRAGREAARPVGEGPRPGGPGGPSRGADHQRLPGRPQGDE